MKTLFFVIPRRISVRYLMQPGGLFDILKNNNEVKIILLTSINDEKFKKEFSATNVEIVHIPMRDGKENFFEMIFRQIRNYVGGVGMDIETFKAKAKFNGQVVYFLYKIGSVILRPCQFIKKFLRWLDSTVISGICDGYYRGLFDKYQPDLIVIHSVNELTAVPLARVAKKYAVPSIGIVLSWDNLTNKGDMYSRCDKLIVWNEIMKDQAVKYHYYKPEDIFVTGTPQFDYYINLRYQIESWDDFCSRKKLDAEKKIILYTTTPERIGGHTEISAIKTLAEALQNGVIPDAQLLVRIYTRDDPKRYASFAGLPYVRLDKPTDLFWDPGESYASQDKRFIIDLASSVKNASVLVNLSSTTSIDAAMFDVPIVGVAFNNKRYWYNTSHFSKLLETGGIRLAYDPEELVALVKDSLKNPQDGRSERKAITERLLYLNDGRSADRIADIIFKHLNV